MTADANNTAALRSQASNELDHLLRTGGIRLALAVLIEMRQRRMLVPLEDRLRAAVEGRAYAEGYVDGRGEVGLHHHSDDTQLGRAEAIIATAGSDAKAKVLAAGISRRTYYRACAKQCQGRYVANHDGEQ